MRIYCGISRMYKGRYLNMLGVISVKVESKLLSLEGGLARWVVARLSRSLWMPLSELEPHQMIPLFP